MRIYKFRRMTDDWLLVGLLATLVWLGAGSQVQSQSLDSLRVLLQENNPELRALAYDYRAALAVSPQLRQLPDLEIGGGVSVLPVETRLGPQRVRVTVRQMLPWPGTLAAMSALADARARPALERAAARQLDLIYQLEANYFDVIAAEAKIGALDTGLLVYQSLQRIALARLENARGSSVDVYRIELETNATRRRIEVLRAAQQTAWIDIEQLVDRSLPRVVVPVEDSLPRVYPSPTDFADHPLVRIFALQEAASRQAVVVNDLEARPDFGVGVDYVVTGPRTDATPTGNGRDALVPRVMLRLPLGGGKYRAKRTEESIRQQAIAARRESVTNRLAAAVERANIGLQDARARRAFLEQQSATVEAALTIARSEYANARRPFDELLRLQVEYLDLRTDLIDARRAQLLQIATIERLLPTP